MDTGSPASQKLDRDLAIANYFGKLKDPRRAHGRLHHLQDILVIALCAVIANAQDWEQIETFGRSRLDWLRGFLELPNGIPSHDTFERVFRRIKPATFQACFRDWVQALSAALPIRHIAIDGKTLRGSKRGEIPGVHLLAVYSNNLGTAFQDQQRFEEAAAHYRRAIAIRSDYAPAYNNLGVALKASGHVVEAVATYEQALRVQPEFPDALYNLANALLDEGHADAAIEHFQIALRSIPGSVASFVGSSIQRMPASDTPRSRVRLRAESRRSHRSHRPRHLPRRRRMIVRWCSRKRLGRR